MPALPTLDAAAGRPDRTDTGGSSAYSADGAQPSGQRRTEALSNGARSVAFAVAYFAAGLLGRWTAPDHGEVVLVAPAAGVAVVWLAASRHRVVDLVLLAAAVAGFHALTLPDLGSVPLHMAVALGQTFVAVELLQRTVPDPAVLRRDGLTPATATVWRALLALLLAAATGATVLVGGLAAGIAPELADLGTWVSFVGRNLTAMTVVVLVGYLLAVRRRSGRWTRIAVSEGVKAVDAVAVVAITTAVYVTVFVVSDLPLAFLTMLVTVWVASRSTPLVATLHATASGAGATLMTALGYGPFDSVTDPVSRAGVLQAFVLALFVTALVVAVQRQQQAVATKDLQRERHRAERQTAVLTAVLDSLSEAVVVLDEEGRGVLTNPPGRRWLAMRDELLRRNGEMTFYDAHGDPVRPEMLPSTRALRGEEVVALDLTFRDTAGEPHVHAVTATPLRTGDRDAAAVLVHREVTEVRDQQDRLSAFAGIVAHDLKNPLASISTWGELLEMELSDHDCEASLAAGRGRGVAEAADAVRGITRASRRMALLIDRLLAQARSRSTVLHLGVVDLSVVVRRVVAERRLDGQVTVPDPLPLVRADEMLVTQLVDNLVGNAAKYVAPGVTPRITVTAAVLDEEVEVRVSDNGIGVPITERPRVFEEFHRSHADGYEGTGLGLAICRVIVERHGGRIDVVDGPRGEGSCFRFTLPSATQG